MKTLTLHFLCVWILCASGQFIEVDDTEGPLDEPSMHETAPSNLQTTRQCKSKLGMESGDISDDQIRVSAAVRGVNNGKENARLNGDSGWVCIARGEQWIQIDLRQQAYISGIQTQGKEGTYFSYQVWVSAYKVYYKVYTRQPAWQAISEDANGGPIIFDGNTDAFGIKTNMFEMPIQAQIVRIVPVAWRSGMNWMAMRLELLGCDIEQESGCGSPKILINPKGFIASMNYPNNYDNNANCRWEITAPRGQTITLQFLDGFALETSPNNCRLEYVEVLDVLQSVERSLGKFCGNMHPGKFTSTYNRLKVQFMSDHYETYSGFRANYMFVNGSGCGGPQDLEGPTGTFQTMNYPDHYDNNAYCVWDIITDTDKLIEIKFLDFKIKKIISAICQDDSVQILNVGKGWNDERSSTVNRYCGRVRPDDYISSSNQLRIMFQSDGIFNDKGFRAIYQAVPASGCGGRRDITRQQGTIHSLNYPRPYANSLRCEWNIIAGPNEDIRVKFLDFELEEHSDCAFDHVSIYDGRSQRYLLGKYCNSVNILPLVAHSGVMKIVFVSDDYNARKGFEASYDIIQRTRPATAATTLPTTTAPSNSPTETEAEVTTTVRQHFTTVLHTNATERTIEPSTQENTTTLLNENTSPKQTTRIAPSSSEATTASTKETMESNDKGQVPMPTEMVKWIIIGLVSVSGLLIILVCFGLFLCCRQQCSSGSVSIQGSLRNGNSGVVQNHAYDFSVASTNQSIRSRQMEPPDTSQVSDSFSHQGTLTHAPSRESHIYFSIDEYCNTKTMQSATPVNKPSDPASIKVHFKKQQQRFNAGDESTTTVQSEEEDYYEDEDEENNTINGDSEMDGDSNYAFRQIGRTSRCNTMDRSFPSHPSVSHVPTATTDGSKVMVDNILYESADSIEQ